MKEKIVRIGVILANETDEIDFIIPVQIWKRANFIVELISLEKKNSVIMKNGIKVSCDGTIDKINLSQFNAIYIPGGNLYKKILDPKADPKFIKSLEKDFICNSKKYILTMNEGISVLTNLNYIKNRKFTGIIDNKEEFDKIYIPKSKVVVSSGLISGIGTIENFEFGLEVVKNLGNVNMYKKIQEELKK